MSLADQVHYTHVESTGIANPHRIEVYALSTCAFCEKAIEWLKGKGVAFDYVYVDLLDLEFKRQLKAELKAAYGNIPVFPLLVLDRSKALSGYAPDKYEEVLKSS